MDGCLILFFSFLSCCLLTCLAGGGEGVSLDSRVGDKVGKRTTSRALFFLSFFFSFFPLPFNTCPSSLIILLSLIE